MTKEEIISEGRPSEPYCFETDTEELWYKIGLYDGATADDKSSWISVFDEMPVKGSEAYSNILFSAINWGEDEITYQVFTVEDITDMLEDKIGWEYKHMCDLIAWMPIPKLPKGLKRYVAIDKQ